MSNADPLDLSAIKALEAAATPGEWPSKTSFMANTNYIAATGPWILNYGALSQAKAQADQDFIAASRAAVPALVKEVEDLRAALAHVSGILDGSVYDEPDNGAPCHKCDFARALLGQPGGGA